MYAYWSVVSMETREFIQYNWFVIVSCFHSWSFELPRSNIKPSSDATTSASTNHMRRYKWIIFLCFFPLCFSFKMISIYNRSFVCCRFAVLLNDNDDCHLLSLYLSSLHHQLIILVIICLIGFSFFCRFIVLHAILYSGSSSEYSSHQHYRNSRCCSIITIQ